MVDIIAGFLEYNRRKRVPRNWRTGITWSGLRGAVSIVLVLGVSSFDLPNLDALLALTYGVVLGTNVVQGLSMPWVVNQLNLYSSSVIPENKVDSS
jgi:CPA1 family monovalent cation:H+ antiporter